MPRRPIRRVPALRLMEGLSSDFQLPFCSHQHIPCSVRPLGAGDGRLIGNRLGVCPRTRGTRAESRARGEASAGACRSRPRIVIQAWCRGQDGCDEPCGADIDTRGGRRHVRSGHWNTGLLSWVWLFWPIRFERCRPRGRDGRPELPIPHGTDNALRAAIYRASARWNRASQFACGIPGCSGLRELCRDQGLCAIARRGAPSRVETLQR